uniref:Rad51-like C-terminal domain-containing protein n=1 Tax=Chromera velia CCMP2878 TaxID=1169474 RepID=A0A0G4IC12_9ALVE|eukprot:Cvel_13006.t1-p1 / transcript=Cvel_13006.t1 / gene=Cvel_13006 / organism=Chromera_velia_CCMP2878 / gene_product=hypothetical protein / transcript_product=hypothetical protein / location=Cvel_scaffold872:39517-51688(+) / protein_length=787 / sequence_SO=supercontig / SO=protein_coding / is_pseudo=false
MLFSRSGSAAVLQKAQQWVWDESSKRTDGGASRHFAPSTGSRGRSVTADPSLEGLKELIILCQGDPLILALKLLNEDYQSISPLHPHAAALPLPLGASSFSAAQRGGGGAEGSSRQQSTSRTSLSVRLPTGLPTLDGPSLLRGGLRRGLLYELVGPPGGLGSSVLWIDTEGTFNPNRLMEVLMAQSSSLQAPHGNAHGNRQQPSPAERVPTDSSAVMQALQRVRVVPCETLEALLNALPVPFSEASRDRRSKHHEEGQEPCGATSSSAHTGPRRDVRFSSAAPFATTASCARPNEVPSLAPTSPSVFCPRPGSGRETPFKQMGGHGGFVGVDADIMGVEGEGERTVGGADRGPALILVDSVAAPARRQFGKDDAPRRQLLLSQIAERLKSLSANFSAFVLVTNQVRVSGADSSGFGDRDGQGGLSGFPRGSPSMAALSECEAALGNAWHHAVNVRMCLDFDGRPVETLGAQQHGRETGGGWVGSQSSRGCSNGGLRWVGDEETLAGDRERGGAGWEHQGEARRVVRQGTLRRLTLIKNKYYFAKGDRLETMRVGGWVGLLLSYLSSAQKPDTKKPKKPKKPTPETGEEKEIEIFKEAAKEVVEETEEHAAKNPKKPAKKPTKKPEKKPETKPEKKPEKKPDKKPDDTKPDDTKPDDTKPEDTKPDDTKPDDTKPDDTKPDDTKPDDTKPDDTKPDDTKPDDTKPDDSNPADEDEPEDTTGEADEDHDEDGYLVMDLEDMENADDLMADFENPTTLHRSRSAVELAPDFEDIDEAQLRRSNSVGLLFG